MEKTEKKRSHSHLKHSEYDYKPIPHKPLSWDTVRKRVARMVKMREEIYEQGVEKFHVYLSPSNAKGAAPSINTIPVEDCCHNCKGCAQECFDVCHDVIYKTVQRTRAINSAILHKDPKRFFDEVSAYSKLLRCLRWHVGGDVRDMDYLEDMIRVARENPHCLYHIFTKNYDVVNEWIDRNGDLPENFRLRLSEWPGIPMPNPHNLNVCKVQMSDELVEYNDHVALCTGDCTACEIADSGCFNKDIKTVVIPLH